jgi:hypothetical protein
MGYKKPMNVYFYTGPEIYILMYFRVCRNQVTVSRSLLFINKYLAKYACGVNESYTRDVKNVMHILYNVLYSKLTNCILVSSDLKNTGSTVLEFLNNLWGPGTK